MHAWPQHEQLIAWLMLAVCAVSDCTAAQHFSSPSCKLLMWLRRLVWSEMHLGRCTCSGKGVLAPLVAAPHLHTSIGWPQNVPL